MHDATPFRQDRPHQDEEWGRRALEASRQAGEVVVALRGLASNIRAYTHQHPAARRSAGRFVETVRNASKHTGRLDLEVVENGFTHHTVPLYGIGELGAAFHALCRAKGIGRVAFQPAVTEGEALAFVRTLWALEKTRLGAREVAERLKAAGVAHVVVEALAESDVVDSDSPDVESRLEETPEEAPRIDSPKLLYRALVELMKEVDNQVRFGGSPGVENIRSLCQDVGMFLRRDRSSLLPLAGVRRYDDYLHTHPVNVCVMASSVMAWLLDDPSVLADFAMCALLFDVGEALLPEDVALVTHPLSGQEKEAFQSHPMRGAALLAATDGLPRMATVAAFEHHIGSDFGGFPRQRRQWRLNLFTLVLSVADRYDALTSRRKAHRILRPGEAFKSIEQGVGSRYDKTAFDALFAMLGPFPPGSWALAEGKQLVLSTGWDAAKETLAAKVVTDKEGRLLDAPEATTLHLPKRRPAPLRALDSNNVPLNAMDFL